MSEPLIPPANTEAEQALLGAILINTAAYGRVVDFLRQEHFANATHGRIYAAAGKLIERGEPANAITLKNLFDQDGDLAEIGGAQYLGRLTEAAVTIINAEHYGRAIHDLHLRRELITIGQDLVSEAFQHDLDDPTTAQIERAEAKLFALGSHGGDTPGLRPLDLYGAIQRAEAAHRGKVIGIATGLRSLDRRLAGLRPKNLIVLAGRPSMGKSALATTIAVRVAMSGVPVAYFSPEMGADEIADRVLAEQARIPADQIRRGGLPRAAFDDFLAVRDRLKDLPLFIEDSSALTVATLRSRARRMKRQRGLGLILVDYLQLLRAQRGRPSDGRVQEVGEIARGLKEIAKDLDVPVVALSQLSRAVEQREDKQPLLADLRESGEIEQNADIAMLLFREEYYLRGDPLDLPADKRAILDRCRGTAKVIIAKNRHGPVGEVRLAFNAALTAFDDLAETA